MKKTIAAIMLAVSLVSSQPANAGILILTGDIGNKFDGYKVVGWLTIILTGVTVLGLVVDEDVKVDSTVKLPELSEASLAIINEATSEARSSVEQSKSSVVTTISNAIAQQIVDLEGLSGSAEGALLFNTLTTK